MIQGQNPNRKLARIISHCNAGALVAIYIATAAGALLCADILPDLMAGLLIASVSAAITSGLVSTLISNK